MKWNKFTIKTTTVAEDLMANMLIELGIDGIEIEDNQPLTEADKKAMFIDFLPKLPPDIGEAFISFYLEEDAKQEELLPLVQEGIDELRTFVELGEGSILKSETEDKDWINNWKKHFKSFTVDDILIKPSWEKIENEDKNKVLIKIDPGMAFGTGKHETTQLCIRQLKKYITKGVKVMDVGTGSGILSIISLKLGASDLVGTDLDPNAVLVAYENALVNGIDLEKFTVFEGNIIDDENLQNEVGFESYDIVVANILADVIISLQKVITKQLKPQGIFISSGIINTKEEEVVKAIEENKELEIIEISRQGEWVSITAKKK
ncbi:MAG: 50S ribosomal protein L11 methyltransferase [Clostridiales bacterium]|nr:50S ribosomal protein L11 methyltransferase [Clostridiales bacterium]